MPSPIEARIWELCSKLATSQDEKEVEQLIPELRKATAEYVQNIRTMALKTIPRTFRADRLDKEAA